MKKGLFSTEQWIAWLGATVTAALTMAAYAFSTFETKADVKDIFQLIDKRLDRIEVKLDNILDGKNTRRSD